MKLWLCHTGALVALAVTACDGDRAPVDAAPHLLRYAAPTCPDALDAPLRLADGSHRCTRVGPASASTGEWPGTTGAATPVVYVRAGAQGVGTREAPFADLNAALAAMPAAATVVVARGTLALDAPLTLTRSVNVLRARSPQRVRERPTGVHRRASRVLPSRQRAHSVEGEAHDHARHRRSGLWYTASRMA